MTTSGLHALELSSFLGLIKHNQKLQKRDEHTLRLSGEEKKMSRIEKILIALIPAVVLGLSERLLPLHR